MFGSGVTTLIMSNEDIMKIVKYLEEFVLLIKFISETLKNETKEQKGQFLGMLLGTLGVSLLRNLLIGKDTIKAGEVSGFLMLVHPLTNFEIQKYYQNEPKLNAVYSRNHLSKIEDGTYAINLDEFKSIGAHWIAWYVSRSSTYYKTENSKL